MGENDRCAFCDVMFAVPAADRVRRRRRPDAAPALYLDLAQVSADRWAGSAWQAAVAEARAHLAEALGQEREFAEWIAKAASLFRIAGQPLDAARCAAHAHVFGPARAG